MLAVASHGLFLPPASEVLNTEALARIVVTDSVPPFRLESRFVAAKVDVVSIVPLVAAAIERLHEGGSLVELLEE